MANFWDEDGSSGWAETVVAAAKPVTAQAADAPTAAKTKPTKEEMATAWNENRGDPAKVYEMMQASGVGVNEAAKFLGVGKNDMARYLNTGRSKGMRQTGSGDDMNFVEEFKYDEVHPEAQTKEEFMATVEPWMLDAQGKFKRPDDGVNYRWEGMTPDEVFINSQPKEWDPTMERDGYGKPKAESYGDHAESKRSTASRASWDDINLKWEDGPDNGGGILGGLARGIGNLATGVGDNPALMAALTAGVGSAMTPATVAGEAGAAASVGGNADKAAMFGNAGYSAQPGILQTFAASPYAKPAMNAAKTLAGGGDLGDAALAAGGSYLGGQASGILGGGAVGNIGGSVVSGLVSGKDPLQVLVSAGANAAAGAVTGNIPGFDALSPSQQSAVNSMVSQALRGKNPTQSLIATVTKMATGQVAGAKPKTTNTTSGGWAA